jgi:hypothetical protein
MLSNAGFDTDAAATALTAFSLLEVGALLTATAQGPTAPGDAVDCPRRAVVAVA